MILRRFFILSILNSFVADSRREIVFRVPLTVLVRHESQFRVPLSYKLGSGIWFGL